MEIKNNIKVGLRYPQHVQSLNDVNDFVLELLEEYPQLNNHVLEGLIHYSKDNVDTVYFHSFEGKLFYTEYHEYDDGDEYY